MSCRRRFPAGLQFGLSLLFCWSPAHSSTVAQRHAGVMPSVFEQVSTAPRAVWRSLGLTPAVRIFSDGFTVSSGLRSVGFRWGQSMQLAEVVGGRPAPSRGYRLVPGHEASVLPHAMSVRAVSRDRKLAIVYYFGSRGLEFDIEAEPGTRLPELRLDADRDVFAIGQDGSLLADGTRLFLKAVAYTVNVHGNRQTVTASYRLESPRRVSIQVGTYNARDRLIVDPVLTYASYFGGSGPDTPLAIRELPDGSLLIAGNTNSSDLPQGFRLNGTSTSPPDMEPIDNTACFVARLSPAEKKLQFVSYLGMNDGYTRCIAMDLDASGRILLAGRSTVEFGAITTPDAQYRIADTQSDMFLARISASGKSLEYASFLRLDFADITGSFFLKAGAGEQVYLASSARSNTSFVRLPDVPGGYMEKPRGENVVLLRYDIAARRFDRKTFFGGGGGESLTGLEYSPSGAVFLLGSTGSRDLPLRDPVQAQTSVDAAGFVAALTADLRSLVFSTYIGGQSGHAVVRSLLFTSDGALRIAGGATETAIPNLKPDRPVDPTLSGLAETPFAMEVVPGVPGFRKGFLAGGWGFGDVLSSFALADGRHCFLAMGKVGSALPGGAATGVISSSSAPLFACLDTQSYSLTAVSPAGCAMNVFDIVRVAPSRKGGLWVLQQASGQAVPFELAPGALQPSRPLPRLGSLNDNDIALFYIDTATAAPELVSPTVVSLIVETEPRQDLVQLSGRNFALGMYLDFDDRRLPLTVQSATLASYKLTPSDQLRAGEFPGRLVIPTQPAALVSGTFPVIVRNLAPAIAPFQATANPRVFWVAPPIYPDSRVTWRGHPLPLPPRWQENNWVVEIPPEWAEPGLGEFTLYNRPPGGGIQRQSATISTSGTSFAFPPGAVDATRIAGTVLQVDRRRKVLYAADHAQQDRYALTAYALPGGARIRTASFPRPSSANIVDLVLSSDGGYLYFTDTTLHVTRFRTDDFVKDLEFDVPNDAYQPPPNEIVTRHQLRAVNDAPESVLVVSPAGRMILFDRDTPRPYTTSDFPSVVVTKMDPVLVTSRFVYAVNGVTSSPVPCLVRYEVDRFGFGPAEDLCSLGVQWGKYPEMKTYSGDLVLEDGDQATGIRAYAQVGLNSRINTSYERAANVSASLDTLIYYYDGSVNYGWVIRLRRLDTGQPVGHFPPQAILKQVERVLFLDDGTMIAVEKLLTSRWATIVPDWTTAIEPAQ